MKRLRSQAFTLVELLVVIGVIAILISILLPALNKARNSGKMIVCQSNMRQLGVAFQQYLGDWRCYPDARWPEGLNPYIKGTMLGNTASGNWVPDDGSAANVDKVSPLGLIHCPSVPFVGYQGKKITLTYSMNGTNISSNFWELLALGGQSNPTITPRVKATDIRYPEEFGVLTEMWLTNNPEQTCWTTTWWRLFATNGMGLLFVHDNRKSNVLYADGHVSNLTYPGSVTSAYSVDTYSGYRKLSDQNDPLFNYDGAIKRNPNLGFPKHTKYVN